MKESESSVIREGLEKGKRKRNCTIITSKVKIVQEKFFV